MKKLKVIFVLNDNFSGVSLVNTFLTRFIDKQRFDCQVIMHHVTNISNIKRFPSSMGEHRIDRIYCTSFDNKYSQAKQFKKLVGDDKDSIFLVNESQSLRLISLLGLTNPVIFLLHGDMKYYYDTALKYRQFINVYLAISTQIFDTLNKLLPNRREDILFFKYPVPIPKKLRIENRCCYLKVIYVGRLENGHKGIFDLPLIDKVLREKSILVEWTIAGFGPDAETLKALWEDNSNVKWLGQVDNHAVMGLCAHNDVLIMPSRAEGLPVILIEAMKVGLVPVVSNIRSGFPDLISHAKSGFLLPVGNVEAFADTLAQLSSDRELLEACSRTALKETNKLYDPKVCISNFESIVAKVSTTDNTNRKKMVSDFKLDKPYLPNFVVKNIRKRLNKF